MKRFSSNVSITTVYRKGVMAIIMAMVFASCGSNSRSNSDYLNGQSIIYNDNSLIGDTLFDAPDQNHLYNLFKTEYYWSSKVPNGLNVSTYTEPQAMINALKYTELDRWSFVYTLNQYENFSTQKNSGFGFSHIKDELGKIVISRVLLSSPADMAGLKRGDILLKINTWDASDELIAQTKEQSGQSTTFEVLRGTQMVTLTITPNDYTFKVTAATTLTTPLGKKVGYLRFDSFTDTATEEIEEAFDYLSTQSLDTLVIDMRYNGGGYLNTASILLDKLVRNHDGLTQYRLTWNEAYSSMNESATFETDTNSIDLKSVYFLTTKSTASASEMVINALRANALGVEVVTIGGTTHGKPVGMSGKVYGGFVYFLINFVTENADGVSDYFDGFTPTCTATDDITHELGDPKEEMLQKALTHIDSGGC